MHAPTVGTCCALGRSGLTWTLTAPSTRWPSMMAARPVAGCTWQRPSVRWGSERPGERVGDSLHRGRAAFRHYRDFVDRRRETRPSEEYRQPTAEEWKDFQEHFSLRKVALGTCHRPNGTPCVHEHACVRCPMLQIDPAQRQRLLAIEANAVERLDVARSMAWLGEVTALEESLRHIRIKREQLERTEHETAASQRSDAPGVGSSDPTLTI